jgi:hypothetical protein
MDSRNTSETAPDPTETLGRLGAPCQREVL